MKGLIQTTIIIAVLIVAGIVTSIVITSNLNSRLAAASERGFEQGYSQGYLLGLQEGSEFGYQEGSQVGYQKSHRGDYDSSYGAGFYFIYNPTHDELQGILADTETGSAQEMHDYATANGLRVAYVRCQIARKAAEGMVYIYQLVAFETVDKGLIVIEPWSHKEVKVEVGKRYSELNGFPTRPYDDTITKITTVW